ncbi:MAG: protein-L-isoaspartate O-methyltransferase family protein [Candidatus Woesearchaeota archaeon]
MEKSFVKYLQERGVARNPRVAAAFRAINRGDFMLEGSLEADIPFPIPAGQTISQPYTVAFMLDKLEVEPGMKVLDVGSGSGWTTALLAHIVGEEGEVVGIEIKRELVKFGRKNISKYELNNAKILPAKEGILGLPEESPFDRILVSAAAKGEAPREFIDQLAEGGILVIPVDNRIEKITTQSKEIFEGFTFVPLQQKSF